VIEVLRNISVYNMKELAKTTAMAAAIRRKYDLVFNGGAAA
jgi:hypothetical protein